IENGRDAFQNLSLIANFEKTVNDHRFSLLGGVTREWFEEGSEQVGTRGFLTESIYVIDAGSNNPEFWDIGGTAADWALQSYIARLNYAYKDKYLLEGTFRYDGSSRFLEDVRWGFFPSV